MVQSFGGKFKYIQDECCWFELYGITCGLEQDTSNRKICTPKSDMHIDNKEPKADQYKIIIWYKQSIFTHSKKRIHRNLSKTYQRKYIQSVTLDYSVLCVKECHNGFTTWYKLQNNGRIIRGTLFLKVMMWTALRMSLNQIPDSMTLIR